MDACLCVLNKKSDKLLFSGGNIDLLIIRNSQLLEFKGTKCPVGPYPKKLEFQQVEIQLKKNDTIYLSTDGFFDQFGSETNVKNKKRFKRKNFINLILKIAYKPCDKQIKILKDTLKNWQNNTKQTDDITVFIAKF